jgi:predicted phage baseplate assembly protein
MPIPLPQLDDTRFQALVDEARLLIPRHAPTWTDHNVHDPGITLIELFAWLAETQIYTLDQVTDRHLEKFLRLLGCPPKPAVPATAEVTFRLPPDRTTAANVPQGTRLIGRRAGSADNIAFETTRDLWVMPPTLELVKIERRSFKQGRIDLTEDWRRRLYIFALGGELGDEIEVGSTLRLGFSEKFPPCEVAIAIALYEADLPPVGAHGEEAAHVAPSVEVRWEYLAAGDRWRALPDLVDETYGLTVSGALRFTGPTDALAVREGSQSLCWLRMRVTRPGYEIPPRLATIRLNSVPAVEGSMMSTRPIGCGSGLPWQRLALAETPVMAGSLRLEVQEEPEGPWVLWRQVADFDASEPADRHFVLDAAAGTILFGDGFRGRIVPRGSNNIRAAYRSGGGERGNLAAGEIARIQATGLESMAVANLEPASRGREPESLAEAWRRLKTDLTIPYRAVTSQDFEAIAKATPGVRVARAKALPGFDPEQPDAPGPCLVTVVVVPYSFSDCPMPSEGFLRTVCCHLDRHRPITTDLRVIAPRYARVSIAAEVTVNPKRATTDVRARIEQALTEFLHPLRGGVEKTGWPFGRAVYRSEIVNLIERLDGVECVEKVQLQASGSGLRRGDDIAIPREALICPGRMLIVATESQAVCEVHTWQSRV